MTYLVPIIVAAAGLVLLVAVLVWLLVLLRRFTAFGTVTSAQYRQQAGTLRERMAGLRTSVEQRRANGTWRFTERRCSRTITTAQE